ncbi:hypothetical protein KGF56_003723 [Candida oxycetoniae]|uniref:Protein BIG1 n=1 Tax=Candida oxycetoniae TaxID=497107 RepID=A0AAI9SV75_9ASCO|nr:uncharacterized protein KGF56_003723 [Candida oxycetoniae]KAI3403439.2 hypothetical protein KGF56_003723 [Candida oxycetoniae]
MQELEQFGDTFSFEHEPEILSADQIDILVNNADTAADDFVIQVVPTFETYSIMEKIESKLGNLYNNYDTVIVSKRDKEAENKEAENTQSVSVLHHLASDSVASDNVEAKNEAQLQQEIENDFALAEKLALEEDKSNSQPITILEDFNKINSTTTQPNNLFTNYQFFTPGIWSGLIISGFLLLILYAAIDWLSSLELTYASFEKQVDFDKKNE